MKKSLIVLLVVLMCVSILPFAAFETDARTLITNPSNAKGSNYTNSSKMAAVLDAIISGDIDIYSNSSCTTEVSLPIGCNMSMSTQFYVKSPNTGSKTSGWQCYIYANAVYNKLFGEWVGHGSSSSNSETVIPGGSNQASYYMFSTAGVRCGAYMRTTNSSSGAYDGNNGHSLVILAYDSSSITYIEGNGNGSGAVRITIQTWDEFNKAQLYGCSLGTRYISHVVQPKKSYFESKYPDHDIKHVKEFYRSYGTVETTVKTWVKTLPCSKDSDTNSLDVEEAAKGTTYTVTALYKNEWGNLWYQVKAKNGKTGYIFAGSTKNFAQLKDDVNIKNANAPTSIEEGGTFKLKGEIGSSLQTITQVYTLVSSNADGIKRTGEAKSVNVGYYNLENSAATASISFAKLSKGEYTYSVNVTIRSYYAKNGTEVGTVEKAINLKNSSFSVTQSQPILSIQYNINGGTIAESNQYKTTATAGLRLRSDASTSASQLTTIPYGTTITVTETKSAGGYTWGKTTYGGKTGWCALDYAERQGYYASSNIVYFNSGKKATTDWKHGDAPGETGLYNATTFGLIKTGYKFLGWSTTPDGSTTVFDQDDNTLTAKDIDPDIVNGSKTVTLYAIWKKEGSEPSISETDRINQQIKDIFAKSRSSNGNATFSGYCGRYVNYQLYHLGINSSFANAGNGKDQYDYYAAKTSTSGGYNISKYPASQYSMKNALNAISNNGTENVYNILVGWNKAAGTAGATYGHVLFIHAIIDGNVYFSENASTTISGNGTFAEGAPIVITIDRFCRYYGSSSMEFDGIIHFEKQCTSHTYSQIKADTTSHWSVCSNCGHESTKTAHSGGTATCTTKAKCSTCSQYYGSYASHNDTLKSDSNYHWTECTVCGRVENKTAHAGGTATCESKAICSTCSQSYGNYATHSDTVKSDSNYHWTECTVCGRVENKTAHAGGTATETQQAVCSTCGTPYGSTLEHHDELKFDGEYHWYECTDCGRIKDKVAHSGGNATCKEKAHCTACGQEYGNLAEHSYAMAWNNTNHCYICRYCINQIDVEEHYGGTATCTEKAKCSICNYKYGELAPHDDTLKSDSESHWNECNDCGRIADKTAHSGGTATATEQAVCSTCGTAYGSTLEHNDELKFDGEYHWYECTDCGRERDKTAHSGGTATCQDKAVCFLCEQVYGEIAGHSFNIDMNDEDNHWHKCEHCEETDEKEAHSYGDDILCDVCGYEKTADTPCTEHTNVLKYDTEYHWNECTNCGTVTGKQTHSGGTASCTTKAECSTCSQKYGKYADHVFTIDKYNDNNHWHQCKNCTETDAKKAHSYGNDNTCDECGYTKKAPSTSGNTSSNGFNFKELLGKIPGIKYNESNNTISIELKNAIIMVLGLMVVVLFFKLIFKRKK